MTIRTILCPIDFTPLSESGLEVAAKACRRFGSRLVIEHNIDPGPPPFMGVAWMWSESHEPELEKKSDQAEVRLKECLAKLPSSLKREAKLTRGPVVESLLYVAMETQANLIVMGSHGPSNKEHSSITEQILAESPCPVLTIRDPVEFSQPGFLDERRSLMQVLVPLDPSEHGMAVARHALDLAKQLPIRLVFFSVVPEAHAPVEARLPKLTPPPVAELESRIIAAVPADLAGRVDYLRGSGPPAEEILRCSARVAPELVVMGCQPRGGAMQVFSRPTTREILHRSPCPVWFVPPSEVGAGRHHAVAWP